METDWLACPFCGSELEHLQLWGSENYEGYRIVEGKFIGSPIPHFQGYVKCQKCGARGPMADSQSGAITLWNRRILKQKTWPGWLESWPGWSG